LSRPSSSRTFRASHGGKHGLLEVHPAFVGLAAQDGQPALELGRRDVHHQPAGELRNEPLVELLDLAGRAVAREDDLPLLLEQVRDQPQQFRLRFEPLRQELDVVDEDHVHVGEPLPECLAVARRDGGVIRVHELLEREVLDAQLGGERPGPGADGRDQVRLAKSGRAVDEERVVRGTRVLGRGPGGAHRQAIGRADHERLEGEARVQRAGHAGCSSLSRRSTRSEMARNVSNTPFPETAAAPNAGAIRKFS
jgi:hypothetical protein